MADQHTHVAGSNRHRPGVVEALTAPAQRAPRTVPPLDAAWLFVESHDTPMHVGCLQIFAPPHGAPPEYALQVLQELRNARRLAPPFNLKLEHPERAVSVPRWVEETAPDMTHHVRHVGLPPRGGGSTSGIPAGSPHLGVVPGGGSRPGIPAGSPHLGVVPGGEAELGSVISSLQGTALDLSRPLWECYLIEGLEGGRFALFIKIHHSLMDGIGGMRLLQSALSTNWRLRHMPPPWASPRSEAHTESRSHGGLNHFARLVLAQLRAAPSVARAFVELVRAALPRARSALSAPYAAPHMMFNGRTSIQRQLAPVRLSLPRIHALAQRAGVTVNDVFLALCAGALRRYLLESDALPDHALVAGIPVSVRPAGDASVGTAITFILAALATDVADPLERLRRIHAATGAAKEHLHRMAPAALTEYTLLLMTPYILELMSGLGGYGPPVFNLAISNVPGPDRPLYYNGARLEAMYPMSILTHGQSLNITTVSYCGSLDVGITACRRAVPHAERIAVYLREALEELDGA